MKNLYRLYRVYSIPIFIILIISVAWIGWGNILSFWFFKGYEPSWLMSVPLTFQGLYRSHAYLYYLDYLLFGWNPAGWYATALVLHTIASLLVFGYLYAITRHLGIAVVAALFFTVSPTYHDVLTWGSFNSYYGLLLSFVILALWLYHRWKLKKDNKFLYGSLLFAFLAYFIRESALTLIPILLLAEFTLYRKEPKVKLLKMVKSVAPFVAVAIVYLGVRHVLGDVSGDYADDSVQLRIRLFHDHLYFQFIWRVVLAFGRHFASLWLPYDLLNSARAFLASLVSSAPFVQKYLFSIIGWVIFGIASWGLYRARNIQRIRLLLFGVVWSVLWIGAISYAIPSSDTVLMQDYFWNTRRYMYYAYVGVSLTFSLILWQIYEYVKLQNNIKYARVGLIGIIAVLVLINIFRVRAIEENLRSTIHAQSRKFYRDFQKEFTSISNNFTVYQFPISDGLNDYLYEWSFLKSEFYPNLKNIPFTTENQIARILEKIEKGKYRFDDVLFVGYNTTTGVINESARVKRALSSAKAFYTANTRKAVLPDSAYPVEIPYVVTVGYRAHAQGTPDMHVAQYMRDRTEFLTQASVRVSATMSQREGEPFLHLLPSNLIDGNFGGRSGWIADSIPAIVTLDLGNTKSVGGLWWSSQEGVRVPSSYTIDVSSDGQKWEQVVVTRLNTQPRRIEFFKKAVPARFVRMRIETTDSGTFTYIDELGIIKEQSVPFAKNFNDPQQMEESAFLKPGLPSGHAKFSWGTNTASAGIPAQETKFLVFLDGQLHEHSFILPDMEIYSERGKFLQKFITGFEITPVGPFSLGVEYVTLKPQYEVKNTR